MNLILHLCIYNLSKPYYHQGSKENYRKGDNDSVLYLLNVLPLIQIEIHSQKKIIEIFKLVPTFKNNKMSPGILNPP